MFRRITMITAMLILASCASKQTEVLVTDPEVNQQLTSLEQNLNAAHANSSDMVSPDNYQDADKALKNAKEDIKKNKDKGVVLSEIKKGQDALAKIQPVYEKSRPMISNVIAARAAAISAGAQPAEMRDADKQFQSLGEGLEKGDYNTADKKSAQLTTTYKKIEAKVS